VAVSPSNKTTSWLVAAPLSGTGPAQVTLTASSAGIPNGIYPATLVFQSQNTVPQFVSVPIYFTVGGSSSVVVNGVGNAFSFGPGSAPGEILSLFGTGLAPASPSSSTASTLPLPTNPEGVSVTFNGVPAPLYYVSPTQLNVQVPYETPAGTAILGVINNGAVAAYTLPIVAAAPGISGAILGPHGPTTSAAHGDVLTIFVSGSGDVTPALASGAAPAATTPVASLPQPRLPVNVTVGGAPAQVLFIGNPGWGVGVTQINFTVPQNVNSGPQPLVVTVGSTPSPAVQLTITQ
jgi:adhesin/invasin